MCHMHNIIIQYLYAVFLFIITESHQVFVFLSFETTCISHIGGIYVIYLLLMISLKNKDGPALTTFLPFTFNQVLAKFSSISFRIDQFQK